MNFRYWTQAATMRLRHSNSARSDVDILLSFVTGQTKSFILAFDETQLTLQQQSCLEALLVRREQGEPMAYLVGEREFWSLPLSVSPVTMIPRPETECLVELALECLPNEANNNILDLGTGTGAIALALATERPDCMVIAVDIQPGAIALALHNAQKLKISNVTFIHSNWFDSVIQQHFALITSNPPYIDANDTHLMQGDLRFEPSSALVAAKQGLAHLDIIIRQAPKYLQPCGWLLLEHGWMQGAMVRELFLATGFITVSTYRDYGHNERVTIGQWPL